MELLTLNDTRKASLPARRLSVKFVRSTPVCFEIKPVEKISPLNNFVDLRAAGVWLNVSPSMPKSNTMNKRSNDTVDKKPAKSRAKRPGSAQNDSGFENNAALPGIGLKMKFILEAPAAQGVKLAADFTQWEKFAVEMTKSENGVWQAVVPLPPGNYSYRFIVDGHWCDDPHSAHKIANPFGTTNSVVCVSARRT